MGLDISKTGRVSNIYLFWNGGLYRYEASVSNLYQRLFQNETALSCSYEAKNSHEPDSIFTGRSFIDVMIEPRYTRNPAAQRVHKKRQTGSTDITSQ